MSIVRQLIREILCESGETSYKIVPPLAAFNKELDFSRLTMESKADELYDIASKYGLNRDQAQDVAKAVLAVMLRETKRQDSTSELKALLAQSIYQVKNPLDTFRALAGYEGTYGPAQLPRSVLTDPKFEIVTKKLGIDRKNVNWNDVLQINDTYTTAAYLMGWLAMNYKKASQLTNNRPYMFKMMFVGYNGSPDLIRKYYDVGLKKEDGSVRALYIIKKDPADNKKKLYDSIEEKFYPLDKAVELKEYIPEIQSSGVVAKAVKLLNKKYSNSKEYAITAYEFLEKMFPGIA